MILKRSGYKVPEQSKSFDLCCVHLLADVGNVRCLCPLHLPGQVLYLNLKLSLLVLKLKGK